MTQASGRNRLLPWIIGLVVVAIATLYVGYLFFATACAAPAVAQFLVLAVIPGVYLALMYLTLKSQP